MGPREPMKWNTQLKKWLFYDIKQASILFSKEYLNKEGLIVYFSTCLCFLVRYITQYRQLGAESLGTQALHFWRPVLFFWQSDSICCSIFMLVNIWYQIFTWSGSNSQVMNFPSPGILFIHIKVKIFESSQ